MDLSRRAARDSARAGSALSRRRRRPREVQRARSSASPAGGALLKHEFVVLLAPGDAGRARPRAAQDAAIRGCSARCGRNVVFGQNVVLRHPHKIHIGDNVVIDDNCLLDAKGDAQRGIRIGNGVFIGRNTILSCKNGDIELADGANIGFNCEIFSASRVRVGRGHAHRGVCLSHRRRSRRRRSRRGR